MVMLAYVLSSIFISQTLTGKRWQSMVDTVPYDGVLTPKKLERILLGGLHPTVRAMIPV